MTKRNPSLQRKTLTIRRATLLASVACIGIAMLVAGPEGSRPLNFRTLPLLHRRPQCGSRPRKRLTRRFKIPSASPILSPR